MICPGSAPFYPHSQADRPRFHKLSSSHKQIPSINSSPQQPRSQAASANSPPPAPAASAAASASPVPHPAAPPAAVPPQRQQRAQNQRLLRQLNSELKDLQRRGKAALKAQEAHGDGDETRTVWKFNEGMFRPNRNGDVHQIEKLWRAVMVSKMASLIQHWLRICRQPQYFLGITWFSVLNFP